MKFQPDAPGGQTINGYGPGWITVNGEKITSSVVLSPSGLRMDWNCPGFEALQTSHFAQLAELEAEFILFGSGEHIRFPQLAWLQSLHARRIGVETMDTQAACRTFNFLAGEGRKVVAALLL